MLVGLLLSALVVRETKHHVSAESKLHGEQSPGAMPSQREVFLVADALGLSSAVWSHRRAADE